MIKTEDIRIRIGIVDSFGKVIGYKADTFWTVGVREEAKPHFLNTFQKREVGPYLRNLLTVLNKEDYIGSLEQIGGRFDNKHSLSVIAEDYATRKELDRISVERESPNKYIIRQ